MLDVYALACVVVLSAVILGEAGHVSFTHLSLVILVSKDCFEQRPSFAPTACWVGLVFADGAMGSFLALSWNLLRRLCGHPPISPLLTQKYGHNWVLSATTI